MSKSDYLENELLDHVLGGGDYTRPATVYVALHTSNPGEDDSGTECTGTGYARVSVTNNGTNFPASSGGAKANGIAVTFPAPGSGGWGLATHFGIYDAATDGNLLYYSSLLTPKTIDEGDTVSFPIGALDVTED